MNKLLVILTLIATQSALSQDVAIRKTIEDFFTAFHAKDTTALKKTFAKEMVLHSIAEKNQEAKVSVENTNTFLKSVAEIPANLKFEEKLLSWKIQQDGTLAHVWTPYEFYINGQKSHSGVNSFSLVKEKDGWKILYCVDTRRR
ncbi:DUF4440 domain-containing protein [Flavobacterium sp.]|uniref:nuclear transport factor 2 family protein n=1 Tax=Flavobacterium sp. TaxID=239 RepID=UPI00122BA8A0|nr:DUF4440 domain-containing protein [Flavobacterium sp.]RZJ72970.1 MAG: DUF4440 domain-containing protein [Flavobacterium sp.]